MKCSNCQKEIRSLWAMTLDMQSSYETRTANLCQACLYAVLGAKTVKRLYGIASVNFPESTDAEATYSPQRLPEP